MYFHIHGNNTFDTYTVILPCMHGDLRTCGEEKQNKKYKYDQCDKGYRSKRYLNLHKTADHPEEGAVVKQFPCDYLGCEKIYKSPDALRIHKKVKAHYVAQD